MNNKAWTKEQLVKELARLQKRLAELEQEQAVCRRVGKDLRNSEHNLATTLNSIGDAVISCDSQGRISRMNPVAQKLTGWDFSSAKGRPLPEVFHIINSISREAAQNPVERVLREGKVVGLANHTALICRDGTEYQIADSGAPIIDKEESGNIIGVVLVFHDVTEQYEMNKALKKTAHDLGQRVKELNCLYSICDLEERPDVSIGEILQGTADLIPPSWQYPEITCARIILDGKEFKTKNFGETSWVQSSMIKVNGVDSGLVQVYYLEQKPDIGEGPFLKEERNLINAIAERLGRIVEHVLAKQALEKAKDELEWKVEKRTAQLVKTNEDLKIEILVRKKAEETITSALKEKEVMASEIHHRVKNNMQVIHSLLRLQSRKTGNKKVINALGDSMCRIKAMALIHESLHQSQNLARINFKTYIEKLVKYLNEAYIGRKCNIEFLINTKDIFISLDEAFSVGLIINELVSNSLKYAFVGREKGEIGISMILMGEGGIELKVGDNGIGIPRTLDVQNPQTLGLQLVRDLVEQQLEGSMKVVRTGGTQFSIRFKPSRKK